MGPARQCAAVEPDGTRCWRPAREDGFCFRHTPADAPADAARGGGGPDDSPTDHATHHRATMANDQHESDIGKVRTEVAGVAEDIVGYPLSGITSIDRDDDGWTVAVEVVERSSVPDTQDILGRYELDLDDDRSVTGYRRTHRYRRDDTEQDL